MGRIKDALLGKPQEPLPPIADERVRQVIDLLVEHNATIMTRVVVHRDMWRRWSQGLAEAIVKAITLPQQRAVASDPSTGPQATQYAAIPLPYAQIGVPEVEGFISQLRIWTKRNNLDLRISLRLREADRLVTRPHFVGGPIVNVKLEVREDQVEAAQTLVQEISRVEL